MTREETEMLVKARELVDEWRKTNEVRPEIRTVLAERIAAFAQAQVDKAVKAQRERDAVTAAQLGCGCDESGCERCHYSRIVAHAIRAGKEQG